MQTFNGKSIIRFVFNRQGASPSVFLLILFIDDLINYLKQHRVEEQLSGLMHCRPHTVDTAVLSMDRKLFVKYVML